MPDTNLIRLCQSITHTGWIGLPLSKLPTAEGEWQIRLFQPGSDVDILQGWTLSTQDKRDEIPLDRELLVDAFQDIAESDVMQAFMIWRVQLPILQVDIEDANRPLAQQYIPIDGAFLVSIKSSISLSKPFMAVAIGLALRFFFQFPEVKGLYLLVTNLDFGQMEALASQGFIRTTLGLTGSAEVMTLQRDDYEKLSHGAGGALMQ